MNSSQVALATVLISVLGAAALGPLFAWLFTRKRDGQRVKIDQYNSETARFDALFKAQAARIEDLEGQVSALVRRLDEKDRQADGLRAENAAIRNKLTDLQSAVRRYFEQVRAAWGKGGSMPMPSDADMHMLELPIPSPETGPIETKGNLA